ncbi:CoA transferase subunit A [Miniphocaeibacter massiliensis]|uniref:CoA transferase subunit A n=1 Tax=Miniphocaeibacter massiliensis TaxID=2041841 RepID=UPI000C1BDA0C|nr:CoA transferase subunit A [Miniphocaeibacter massiliensis]
MTKVEGKVVTLEEAMVHINNGDTIMVGGFAGTGNPVKLINGIVNKGVKDLTLICNDTGLDESNVGALILSKLVKKAIVSHIGTNPETGRQLRDGEIEVEFVPQGTLIERIRCGGFGLGGVLTPTGVGTNLEKGKEKIEVEGKEYLLETPLKANVTIIKAKKADKMGNLIYHGTNKAHGPMMATASDITIVQADEVVEVGELNPDMIETPSIFVDYIVEGGN